MFLKVKLHRTFVLRSSMIVKGRHLYEFACGFSIHFCGRKLCHSAHIQSQIHLENKRIPNNLCQHKIF